MRRHQPGAGSHASSGPSSGGAATELPTGLPDYYLVVENGPPQYLGIEFVIAKSPTTIGRSEGVDIQIAVPSLSRRHAAIAWSPEGFWTVTDLKSMNGVTLNGERVDAARIRPDDRLGLGDDIKVTFHVRGAGREGQLETTIVAEPSMGPPETRALTLGLRRASIDAVLVADVIGRVDRTNYLELKGQLMAAVEAGERFVIVNLARVSVMDHTGLSVLVHVRASLESSGGGLRVAAATRTLTESISQFRLEPLLLPCATEAEAVQQLRPLVDKRS